MKKISHSLVLAIAFCGQSLFAQTSTKPTEQKPNRSITLVNYETFGVKQWVPGTIIVKEGDVVELTLINKVPSGVHGFSIPDFGVQANVMKDKNEKVVFTVNKPAGIYDMKCHLHPAHVGGQLLVVK